MVVSPRVVQESRRPEGVGYPQGTSSLLLAEWQSVERRHNRSARGGAARLVHGRQACRPALVLQLRVFTNGELYPKVGDGMR